MPEGNAIPDESALRDESNFRLLAEKFFEPRITLFSRLHDPSLYPMVEEYCGFDIDSHGQIRKTRPEVTDEERDLLAAFRRFKIRMRGREDVFHWKTTAPDGVQIVADTAEIILPSEVFPGK